ncbi:GNAT family N-acetyltransferase [Microbacterium sp. NEAU-LLC]|uniref:GNAT family N-acetyltransferase n=1 Tax=Microbacterium helvum TaxID=2773713 RepID=A0ABR8NIH9_9MICO|nr:GNAT family N-acetyltransferase [Microbacterium helvum]MBD3940497.1 GNAT family N-acetyltransferase [Microbacterium helvum]
MRRLTAEEVGVHAPHLLDLQHKAYAVEAELIGDDRIPPLHETESDLLSAGLEWIASFDDDQQIAGAAGYAIEHDVVDLDRLMISPSHHRQGLGTALVTEVMELAPVTEVATGRDNAPARALYESLGFLHQSDFEPVPGLWVSRYRRA